MILASLIAQASPTSSPSPLAEPPAPPVGVPELLIGAVLAALGIRSLVRWMRTEFVSESLRDQALFLLHSGSRVGLWFALAGFFFGFALVDETARFVRWYVFVPIGLAGLQLMTAVFLGRSPLSSSRGDEKGETPARE